MANKLVFQVKGSNQPFFQQDEIADFVLLESDWDDFGYRTSYNVVATEKLLNGRPECIIGSIKIIQNIVLHTLSRRTTRFFLFYAPCFIGERGICTCRGREPA